MRGAFLEDLTWPEASAGIAAGAVVQEITRELVDGLVALYPDLR